MAAAAAVADVATPKPTLGVVEASIQNSQADGKQRAAAVEGDDGRHVRLRATAVMHGGDRDGLGRPPLAVTGVSRGPAGRGRQGMAGTGDAIKADAESGGDVGLGGTDAEPYNARPTAANGRGSCHTEYDDEPRSITPQGAAQVRHNDPSTNSGSEWNDVQRGVEPTGPVVTDEWLSVPLETETATITNISTAAVSHAGSRSGRTGCGSGMQGRKQPRSAASGPNAKQRQQKNRFGASAASRSSSSHTQHPLSGQNISEPRRTRLRHPRQGVTRTSVASLGEIVTHSCIAGDGGADHVVARAAASDRWRGGGEQVPAVASPASSDGVLLEPSDVQPPLLTISGPPTSAPGEPRRGSRSDTSRAQPTSTRVMQVSAGKPRKQAPAPMRGAYLSQERQRSKFGRESGEQRSRPPKLSLFTPPKLCLSSPEAHPKTPAAVGKTADGKDDVATSTSISTNLGAAGDQAMLTEEDITSTGPFGGGAATLAPTSSGVEERGEAGDVIVAWVPASTASTPNSLGSIGGFGKADGGSVALARTASARPRSTMLADAAETASARRGSTRAEQAVPVSQQSTLAARRKSSSDPAGVSPRAGDAPKHYDRSPSGKRVRPGGPQRLSNDGEPASARPTSAEQQSTPLRQGSAQRLTVAVAARATATPLVTLSPAAFAMDSAPRSSPKKTLSTQGSRSQANGRAGGPVDASQRSGFFADNSGSSSASAYLTPPKPNSTSTLTPNSQRERGLTTFLAQNPGALSGLPPAGMSVHGARSSGRPASVAASRSESAATDGTDRSCGIPKSQNGTPNGSAPRVSGPAGASRCKTPAEVDANKPATGTPPRQRRTESFQTGQRPRVRKTTSSSSCTRPTGGTADGPRPRSAGEGALVGYGDSATASPVVNPEEALEASELGVNFFNTTAHSPLPAHLSRLLKRAQKQGAASHRDETPSAMVNPVIATTSAHLPPPRSTLAGSEGTRRGSAVMAAATGESERSEKAEAVGVAPYADITISGSGTSSVPVLGARLANTPQRRAETNGSSAPIPVARPLVTLTEVGVDSVDGRAGGPSDEVAVADTREGPSRVPQGMLRATPCRDIVGHQRKILSAVEAQTRTAQRRQLLRGGRRRGTADDAAAVVGLAPPSDGDSSTVGGDLGSSCSVPGVTSARGAAAVLATAPMLNPGTAAGGNSLSRRSSLGSSDRGGGNAPVTLQRAPRRLMAGVQVIAQRRGTSAQNNGHTQSGRATQRSMSNGATRRTLRECESRKSDSSPLEGGRTGVKRWEDEVEEMLAHAHRTYEEHQASASGYHSSCNASLPSAQKLLREIETAEEKDRTATIVFDLDETLCNNRRTGPALLRPGAIELFQQLRAVYPIAPRRRAGGGEPVGAAPVAADTNSSASTGGGKGAPNLRVELIVWTASMESVARPVIARLDPDGTIFDEVIYRDLRWFRETNYTKDLRRLGRHMQRTLIVENAPSSVTLNHKNAILVTDFINSPTDRQLLAVREVLLQWLRKVGVYLSHREQILLARKAADSGAGDAARWERCSPKDGHRMPQLESPAPLTSESISAMMVAAGIDEGNSTPVLGSVRGKSAVSHTPAVASLELEVSVPYFLSHHPFISSGTHYVRPFAATFLTSAYTSVTVGSATGTGRRERRAAHSGAAASMVVPPSSPPCPAASPPSSIPPSPFAGGSTRGWRTTQPTQVAS